MQASLVQGTAQVLTGFLSRGARRTDPMSEERWAIRNPKVGFAVDHYPERNTQRLAW
jgi:hypothetical protein